MQNTVLSARNSRLLLLIFLVGAFSAEGLFAQRAIQLKIGMLHGWFRADGVEPEEGFGPGQQFGLAWPALYQRQDNQAAKGLWFGTKNYTDAAQYGGNSWLHKVVHKGPRDNNQTNEFMPVDFRLIGKFDTPQVLVDGLPASELFFVDEVDEVDPDLVCDRLIHNVVNTSIGITMTRRVYAWGQQYHDNYFIYEYIFENTGNVDDDPEIEQQVTLEDVYFFFQYRYATSLEGATWTGLNSPRWGINEMLTTRGEGTAPNGGYADFVDGNSSADSLRCQIAWMGRHSAAAYDLIASPDVQNGTGRLGSPQFVGNVTLHVDTAPDDRMDDPTQPTTTSYEESDDNPTQPNDQFNPSKMSEEWDWITKGYVTPRHDEAVGEGFPDRFANTGGYSNANGYGPWTLAPGDSIRLVIAEGVNGIRRELCETIGADWIEAFNNPSASFTFDLPDGGTTSDEDEYKNAWFFTGMDSIFKTFGRARRNFESGFDIPQPPPPPSRFLVDGGGDRVALSWSNDAESAPNFGGYRIYRAIAKFDTLYTPIFECGAGTDNPTIVNEYEDRTPVRGKAYYYYIVSFSDGSMNNSPANPGGSLESSLFWTRTTQPAFLKRAATADMDSIRIVPNPYDIRAALKDQQFPSEPDKMVFYNIPGECTIRIYTERGDLIKTIEHVDGSGDESWNSNTDFGQVVVSGVYIAVIEKPTGESAIRKFVVIR